MDISLSEAYFASCVALRLCCSVFWGSKVNTLSYSGFCQTALVPTMVAALADQGVAEVRDGSESGIGKTKFTIPLLKSAYNENALVAHCSSAILRRVLLLGVCSFGQTRRRSCICVLISPADHSHHIQYETNSDDVRRLFEEHGEIKTFFDLISNRGMVFVTYVSGHIVLVACIV